MHEFNKEEQELEKSKLNYQQLSISDDLANQAILEGMNRAKNRKAKKRKYSSLSFFLAASILIAGFISSIKISDTMADYMSNVPGIETIVKFIRHDKGLLAAAENNFFQKIEASDEVDGLKVTIDSIIHDERNLIVLFHYEAINNNQEFFPIEINLLTADREILPSRSAFTSFDRDGDSFRVAKFPLNENDVLPEKLIASFEFSEFDESNEFIVGDKKFDRNHEIAFSINKDNFAKKEVYQLNQTISVEGQKITIQEVTLYPSQADVKLIYDENNSKRIFGIDDFELIDEAGRVWRPYADQTFNLDNEEGRIIHLESPYFSNPEELSLRFSSIRALDKDEIWVEIDPIQQKILKAPKDGRITELFFRKEEIGIILTANYAFLQNQIFMYAEDADGNIIGDGQSLGAGGSPSDNYVNYFVPYPSDEVIKGPIRLKLLDYPATINKEIKLKIK